ncbi:MAG: hypothetical protein EBS33_05360, partial [Alphaproteobacteria bacterium]|nr:hypothetical protein [Alphaproteobacteria bacterium]
ELAKALANHNFINGIDLNNNKVTDLGGFLLTEYLSRSKQLTEVYIKNNLFSDEFKSSLPQEKFL